MNAPTIDRGENLPALAKSPKQVYYKGFTTARKLLYPTKCRSNTVAKLGNLLTYSYEKDDL